MPPKVSVVIAVYNRDAFIEQCVHSVLNQIFQKDYEVIVVDDGSTDSTREVLARFSDGKLIVMHHEINQGASYARNRGILQASGQYIAFLDSDCIAQENWLEEIIKPFDLDDAIMITAGKTMGPSSGNYWQQANEGQNYIARKDGYVRESHSCNMALRADFAKANLFDGSLPSFSDDLDLCLRCLRKNFKIYYTSKAGMVHFFRSTLMSSLYTYFYFGAYNVFIRLKWKEFPILNYGTYILLAAWMCLCGGLGGHIFWKHMGEIFFCIYMILVFYIWSRSVNKNFLRSLFFYPVRFVFSLTNSIGNFWGVMLFLQWKLGYRRGV